MKKFLLIGVACLLSTSLLAAEEQKVGQSGKAYVSVKAGISAVDLGDNLDDTIPNVGVGLGYKWNNFLRTELDYTFRGVASYKEQDYGFSYKEDMYTNALTGQLYVDIPTQTPVTPFVNVGGGVAFSNYEAKLNVDMLDYEEKYKDNDTTFTWNAGAGVNVKVTDRISVDAMYKYVDYGKPFDIKVTSNDFILGMRMQF